MRNLRFSIAIWLVGAGLVAAQTPPQLIPFGGVAPGAKGQAPVTFAIYEEQTGGVPLWVEVQVVTTDARGNFHVLLGEASTPGVLADVFASGEPHWVGVQVAGQEEQSRSLLATVPYAMKAGDANTVGGLPVTAFVLADSADGGGSGSRVTRTAFSRMVRGERLGILDLGAGQANCETCDVLREMQAAGMAG